jgi:hypothetical protein
VLSDKLSRWVGLLEVASDVFESTVPIFTVGKDPCVLGFKVRAIVWLPAENGIPIHDAIWNALSFTRDLRKKSSSWTGKGSAQPQGIAPTMIAMV